MFCISYIDKPAALYDTTNPDWVPTLKMGHDRFKSPTANRHVRLVERAHKRKRSTAAQALINFANSSP